ncbi:multidrug resistance protein 1 variant [Zopfochytrium polystomum]|nr:multidrug resistance protein 1 variant [Zopfochytrium polystomum]
MNTLTGRLQARILALYSVAGNIAEESLTSVRTVTAFNGQNKLTRLYAKELGGARTAGIRKSIVTGTGFGTLFCVIYLAYSLAFYYGSVLLETNSIDAGTVVNVMFAVLIGAFALGQIAPELQAFAFGVGAGSKIFTALDRVPPIDALNSGGKKLSADEVKGHIVLKQVEFTYPSRPDVKILKKMDLNVEPGTTVALVGQSGSGKSTIIQLLERFYDAEAGEILFDGHNITDLNISWLRHQIGYVSQEPTLFEGSVFQNVALGLTGTLHETASREVQFELVEQACKMANAHDFILRLPQGYDTEVGERGLLLSGGQKQRIAIARAVVRNPKVLLLDEATSALDTTSERVVQAALDNASKGRTTIVIAHRLSTIRNANLIVCMARGEVVERGTHEELIRLNGMYKGLVDAQQLIQKENEALVKDLSEADELQKAGGPSDDVDAADEFMTSKSDKKSLRSSVTSLKMLEERSASKMKYSYIIKQVVELNRPELKYTIPALFAAFLAGMVIPLFSIFFSSLLQAFAEEPGQREKDLHFWSSMFVVIAAYALVTNFAQNTLFGFANEYLTERVRDRLFTALLRQDIAFFDDSAHSTGQLTSSLSSDAQKVQGAAGVTLGTALQLSATLFGGLAVGFAYGWKLSLVAMVVLPVLVAAGAFRMSILTYFHEKAKKSYERSAQVATESVAAIRTVQSLTTEGRVHAGYLKLLEQPLKDGYRNAALNTILYGFAQCANFLGNALVFWYGGHLIAYDGYTVKTFFVVFMAVMFGSISAGRIFAFVPDLTKALSSAESILEILERKPDIDSDSTEGSPLTLESVKGEVEFRDVRFVYPSRPSVKVLRGLNITVKPGQFVALVGSSGSGKSTTIGLLERFYDPVSGQILIDGQDVKSLNIRQYRDVVGLVSQEPNLFDMTLEDNITFGCVEKPSREEIESAARQANIHDFIMSLPDGYKTKVGAKGGQLSGGQKQRVAIARALVRHPKVLLLDEATSALDAESEKVVQQALDAASRGRTTIAIAHRLSSIQHADVIYFLKDGRVAEAGTHQELYDKRGLYYELVIQQDLAADEAKKKK